MKHHEFASLFPMLPDAELQSLAQDIRENGLQTPIVTLDDAILDGRNRYRACEIAGVDPTFEEYLGADPLAFVLSHNLHRRHLNESQRGMVAARLATLKNGQRLDQASPIGEAALPRKDREQAASELNVGTTTLDRARRIQRDCAPEVVAAVESGDLKLSTVEAIRDLPHEEQAALVQQGHAAVKAKAKEIRDSSPADRARAGLPTRTPKFVPDDAERLWVIAQSHLDKILPSDKSRERVLQEVIAYAEKRIADAK